MLADTVEEALTTQNLEEIQTEVRFNIYRINKGKYFYNRESHEEVDIFLNECG